MRLLSKVFSPVLGEALININFENMHPIILLYSDTKTLCKAEEDSGGSLPYLETEDEFHTRQRFHNAGKVPNVLYHEKGKSDTAPEKSLYKV